MSTSGTAGSLTRLVTLGTIEEQCISNSAIDLAEFIQGNFAVDTEANDAGIVVSSGQPSPDERSSLWVRLDGNRNFLGMYLYNGQARDWIAITPLPTQEGRIYWKFDPARNLADLPVGYEIDDDAHLSRDQKSDSSGALVYAWIKSVNAKY